MNKTTNPLRPLTLRTLSSREQVRQTAGASTATRHCPAQATGRLKKAATPPSALQVESARRQQTRNVVRRARTATEHVEFDLLRESRMVVVGEIASGIFHDLGNVVCCLDYYSEVTRANWRTLTDGLRVAGKTAAVAVRPGDAEAPVVDLGAELESLRSGVVHLVHLLRDVRALTSEGEDCPVALDVNACVERVARLAEYKIRNRIELTLELEPLPRLTGHPTLLVQALLNVVLNAVQAIEGHGALALHTHAAADSVVIQVRDSGRGMTPAQQRQMFDLHYTTKPKGQGLGLASVRRTVALHGGSIHVESQVGCGTTFRITLPVHWPPNV